MTSMMMMLMLMMIKISTWIELMLQHSTTHKLKSLLIGAFSLAKLQRLLHTHRIFRHNVRGLASSETTPMSLPLFLGILLCHFLSLPFLCRLARRVQGLLPVVFPGLFPSVPDFSFLPRLCLTVLIWRHCHNFSLVQAPLGPDSQSRSSPLVALPRRTKAEREVVNTQTFPFTHQGTQTRIWSIVW